MTSRPHPDKQGAHSKVHGASPPIASFRLKFKQQILLVIIGVHFTIGIFFFLEGAPSLEGFLEEESSKEDSSESAFSEEGFSV